MAIPRPVAPLRSVSFSPAVMQLAVPPLAPTPGNDRIAAAYEAIKAAADELDAAVALNRTQVAANNEHVISLNQQSTELTATADQGEAVASNLRAILGSSPG
jgi:hypothetical protein